MKQTLLTFAALMWPVFLFAQKTIVSPDHGMSNSGNLTIEKIELTDTATVFSFHYTGREGQWMSVPTKAYVQLPDSDDQLYATGTDGIPFGEKYYFEDNKEIAYRVFFPPVPEETVLLNFGEDVPRDGWYIYDIQLKEPEHLLPAYVRGHFFDSYTGLYAASVLRDQVVYDQKVWAITASNVKKNKGSLKLQSGDEELVLYFARDKDFLQLGPDKEHLQSLSKRRNRMAVARNGNVDLETPEFSLDSAEYSGYVIGFNPRYGTDRFTVSYKQVTNRREEKLEVKVDSTGYFHCKVPILYPHTVFVYRSGVCYYPYLEPGKKLFQVFDLSNLKQNRLFMGEGAAMSSELIAAHRVSALDRSTVMDSIKGGAFAEYKALCQSVSERDLKNLDQLYTDGKLSKRAWQLHQLDAKYMLVSTLFSYDMAWARYYSDKRGEKLGVTLREYMRNVLDTISMDFTDVITNELANNPYAPSSNFYSRFLNGFINHAGRSVRRQSPARSNYSWIDTLRVRGEQFTEDDEKAIAALEKSNAFFHSPLFMEYRQEIRPKLSDFQKKYRKQYDELLKVYAPDFPQTSQFSAYLTELGIVLTPEEEQVISAANTYENSEEVKALVPLMKENREYIVAFNQKYKNFRFRISEQQKLQAKEKFLKDTYGIEAGLLTDLMTMCDVNSKIYNDRSPLNAVELSAAKARLQSDDYKNYLDLLNDAIREQMASLDELPIGNIRSVPNVENEKLFAEILKRYKGKVVLVDFWATWCGPCVSGIQQIRPLKAEMEGKEVVFLYLTGESSPELTWRPKTADIPGEHFRLSREQWSAVCNQFNVSGIPRYMLVNRQGEVVNDNVGHMSNTGLKLLFEKYLNSEQSSMENATNPSN